MFDRALLIEDNAGVATALRIGLRAAGVEMRHAETLEEARAAVAEARPEVMLVDLILPDGNGLEMVRWAREQPSPIPVVILTGLDDEEHVVEGLGEGADLYIKKPFTARELVAHLDALHRRLARSGPVVEYGGVRADLVEREARRGGLTARLTDVETRLLAALLEARGELVTRDELLLDVWNLTFDPGTGLLHSHIRNLRRRLRPLGVDDWIVAVRGQGYRFESQPGG